MAVQNLMRTVFTHRTFMTFKCSELTRPIALTGLPPSLRKTHGLQYRILSSSTGFRHCNFSSSLVKLNKSSLIGIRKDILNFPLYSCCSRNPRLYSTDKEDEEKKLSLYQRFKQMYRDYWYVLVPVHIVTSIGWFGGFYYLAKSGVDVVGLLECIGISESITKPLKDSSAGYIAISYALYKLATPLRYTVTLGGTTVSIKYLKEWGLIKPIPPREKLKEMYAEKKETFKERKDHMLQKYRQRHSKKD